MSEIRTAREIAEDLMLDHARDIEWLTIGETTEAEAEALDEEAYAALKREVDDLITRATITITFRDEHGRPIEERP